MILSNLKLTNFRNFGSLDLNFCENVNIIYGKNGSGKTNLVESIYMLALTKSFRSILDKKIIKKGTNELVIDGTILTNIKTYYKITINEKSKSVEIDNNKKNKISEYVSNINVILFNPDDTKIVKDSPSERRKLLNIELSKIYKEYLLLLTSYNKILKLRNMYLRELAINGNASKEYLDILTRKLIEIGYQIYEYRDLFIEDISKYIGKIYKEIFGYGDLVVKYYSNYNNKDVKQIFELYKENYPREIKLGKTVFGIHKDDIHFLLDDNLIKEWGSTGQQKNTIISFKLAELTYLKEEKGKIPILILDDLFSELDKEKVDNILKTLKEDVQIFITTTSIKNLKLKKFKKYKIFKVENNQIEEIEDE